ncbi:sigma-70 family RNA polymerase sigma factor [Anaerotruncus rubiinfantis]|uniref:sigma-70 family RNA polymerase sigma factor n=1 Tax=Anaerotruncus rubiinfantis TaxID=1720200 RepID=UPI000829918C|nr:sigma-70 family RNA polymerase sigma factor [Anaerotruncus rubiinfantis]
MTKIQNLNTYCRQCVRNSLKNEYRQNDNAAKHITPVGLRIAERATPVNPCDEFEELLSCKSPEDWLLFIECPDLHKALSSLQKKDLELLFLLFVFGYTQQELSHLMGISQAAINKRYSRIKKT